MNRKNVHRFEDPIIGDRGTCITSLSCSSMMAQWLSFVGATSVPSGMKFPSIANFVW